VNEESGVEYGAEKTFTTPGFPAVIIPPAFSLLLAFTTPVAVQHVTRPVSEATSARKLVRAVKLCQKKPKKRRAACIRRARKRYGLGETEK
jgi:hypothetical protein